MVGNINLFITNAASIEKHAGKISQPASPAGSTSFYDTLKNLEQGFAAATGPDKLKEVLPGIYLPANSQHEPKTIDSLKISFKMV